MFSAVSNKTLIIALQKGEIRAFEFVYQTYFRGLVAFSRQYIDHAQAEEIVQDTMLWIWENKDQLNEALSLKSLLFTIVKNKSLNAVSHNKIRRKVHQEIVDKFDETLADPEIYLSGDLFTRYAEVLSDLPQLYKEAYDLNRSKNMTYKEIAEKMGVSVQTVNYRICQALNILRKELKEYLPLVGWAVLYYICIQCF